MSALDAPFNYLRMPRSVRDLSILEGTSEALLTSPYNGAVATGSVNISIAATQLPVNHMMWCENFVIATNLPCELQLQVTQGGIRGTNADTARIMLGAMQTYSHRVESLLTQSMCTTNSLIAAASIRRLRNADGTDATVAKIAGNDVAVAGTLQGRLMYDDTNFTAKKVIKFVGDSIFRGTGRTTKANCLDWKIRQYYADTVGLDVRGVMKAVSGSTTSNHETWRSNGWHDEPQIDLLVYYLGTNDAGTSISDTTVGDNLSAFITMKQRRYPNAKMLVLGLHPLENVTSESFAALYRTKAQSLVTAAADSKIMFCNLGQLGSTFSSVAANYASTDTAGQRVHPSDQGDGYMWNGNIAAGGSFTGVKAFLQANIATI